ncbi:sensor histidine kinase [Allosphingosinicella indica]|nr:histidine kinase [Allosphingosinicella indica]
MDFPQHRSLSARLPDLGLALKTMAAFWSFYFVLVTTRAALMQFEGQEEMFQRRIAVVLAGLIITFGIYLILRPLAQASLAKKGIVAGLVCLPASFIFATFSYYAFYLYSPLEARYADEAWMEKQMSDWSNAITMIADSTTSWYFFFACWAAFYVAMSYAAQLRASDTRAAAFAREAQEAQLRALRYQINPHFLFNTLNSLSSLILSQRTDVAERMIMNLSTFFRTTLSADPTADVPLEEEIKLQRLYLDIEQVRFPERLNVVIDIPDELKTVRVPILILQPVVENAIKYGVAKSRKAVTLSISARTEAGRLHIKVRDDGDAPPPEESSLEGTGVGLRNVCDRLIARYGVQAGCFHGGDPQGGYTVHVIMPLVADA